MFMLCNPFPSHPTQPEVTAAEKEMDSSGEFFAFVLLPSFYSKEWNIYTKQGSDYSFIQGVSTTKDEANAIAAAWLQKQRGKQ